MPERESNIGEAICEKPSANVGKNVQIGVVELQLAATEYIEGGVRIDELFFFFFFFFLKYLYR